MAEHRKFLPAVKDAVELALETTAKQKDISKAHGVSEAYITKVKRQKRDKELGLDEFYPKNGRPPIMHDAAVADLAAVTTTTTEVIPSQVTAVSSATSTQNPLRDNVYIFEENASGFTAGSDLYHWIPIPSATDIKTFMAIPLALCKLTAASESHSTTRYLVAYQPVDNVNIDWLKRPSECEQLRYLQPRKDLHLKIDTEHK
ncbi:hypothetical protein LTR93_011139 [Exophiala xenobiotica]|nr:hypothetical protein LTR93_011139 [Exophiala xenobiotica]